uniref:Glutathione S-transferase C-terminal domain-containing protein n=1 Tax=Geotrypetes seraphini TaxID=260995 RepID=A0A6P8S399_GEOSA|nr:glutathione S-transferase C-terminal domain-containing protein isoform X3 [Geotrypetes seraphini]
MKSHKEVAITEYLYLEVSPHPDDYAFPLHTAISLFLMTYCDCKIFKVFLVPTQEIPDSSFVAQGLLKNFDAHVISRQELPFLIQNCCLPAILEKGGRFCRAGLAVVLRCIIQKVYEIDRCRKNVLELLGFKKTCLKACAEVFVSKKCEDNLVHLPLLSCWYRRIQAVPGVKKAAAKCGIQFIPLPDILFSKDGKPVNSILVHEEKKDQMDNQFLGGPRPTMRKLMEKGIEARFSPHPCPSWTLDWKSLPTDVSPAEGSLVRGDNAALKCWKRQKGAIKGLEQWSQTRGPGATCGPPGKMSGDRALRKQQQLNNLVSVVMKLAKPRDTIVDFCSGGGHVGIVLAHTLPSCQVVLIENKEESLLRAQERTSELGLNNIWFIQANLDYFKGKFNIGVALHACGVATDMVIEHCIRGQASFVICPCCYGFIQNTTKSTFPRSHRFREAISYKEHMILCRFADQTAVQLPSERRLIGKHCMGLVDLDRAWSAEGHGYSTQVISMEPESCSPKNNMIVGVPL